MEEFNITKHDFILNNELGVFEREKLLKILEIAAPQERDAIWKKLISSNHPGDLRTALHLDYVFQTRGEHTSWKGKKIAVIAHVNYTDLIEQCWEYICAIPEYIDVYISTKGNTNIALIKRKIEMLPGRNIKIVVPKDRGREISSLLVACKDILMKYEYLCFVHDKKKNTGEPFQTVGQSFCDILWENSIKNDVYIENVIEKFEKEQYLGVLAPPTPYASLFFTIGFSGWTGCYEKTKELAKRLQLNCKMDELHQPYILGTTFWCRTKALQPIFEGDIDYLDFDPEPMRMDNTISHAIERIWPYVAQSQGYYSGIMMTDDYASTYLCNYEYMINQIVNKVIYSDIFNEEEKAYSAIPIKRRNLLDFCDKYSNVYVYGNGNLGKECMKNLKNKVSVKGFVASDEYGKSENVCGYPTIGINSLVPGENLGIIIAMNTKDLISVYKKLTQKGFKNVERYM